MAVNIGNEIALLGEAKQLESDAGVVLVDVTTVGQLTTPPPYVAVTDDAGEAPILAEVNESSRLAVAKYNSTAQAAANTLNAELAAARTAGRDKLLALVGSELTAG